MFVGNAFIVHRMICGGLRSMVWWILKVVNLRILVSLIWKGERILGLLIKSFVSIREDVDVGRIIWSG